MVDMNFHRVKLVPSSSLWNNGGRRMHNGATTTFMNKPMSCSSLFWEASGGCVGTKVTFEYVMANVDIRSSITKTSKVLIIVQASNNDLHN